MNPLSLVNKLIAHASSRLIFALIFKHDAFQSRAKLLGSYMM